MSIKKIALVFVACAAGAAVAASSGASAADGERTAPLFENMGSHHHAITTKSEEAQKFFDQGLILVYGFNHAEAVRSFKEAARLDPECAMCFWGWGLALGPNINKPMDEGDVPEAHEAAMKALDLARAGHASPVEKSLIEALAKRYPEKGLEDRSERDKAFADAMRETSAEFPEDLDAATLFAESVMDLMPWDYYEENGEPKPATVEVIGTLEKVIQRDENHPGAIHYYIHAVEASSTPERAEAGADRLRSLVPGAGHLVHMPSHIYLRVGRYDDAVAANVRAAAADESYIDQCNAQGFYPALYYPHNIHFLWFSATLEGRSQMAIDASRRLVGKVPAEMIAKYASLQQFKPIAWFSLVRFGKWDEILEEEAPPGEWAYPTAMWHYVQGMAHVRKGQIREAKSHSKKLAKMARSKEIEALDAGDFPALKLARIATLILQAEIDGAAGKPDGRVAKLTEAVEVQDSLSYTEPPYWYYPVRQSLGAALLDAGRPAEAEAVYRADLAKTPRNGWSLFGLAQALKAQEKAAEAAEAAVGFEQAWARADFELPASAL